MVKNKLFATSTLSGRGNAIRPGKGPAVPSGEEFPNMHFHLLKAPNYVCNLARALTQAGENSMRKLLFTVAMILGVGLFVASTITPTPAQPVDCSKKAKGC
jgi:hypothetical protein